MIAYDWSFILSLERGRGQIFPLVPETMSSITRFLADAAEDCCFPAGFGSLKHWGENFLSGRQMSFNLGFSLCFLFMMPLLPVPFGKNGLLYFG